MVYLMHRFLTVIALCVLLLSCSSSRQTANNTNTFATPDYSLYSPLLIKGQLPAPQSIKSIQLYRKGNSQNPPIIKLGSSARIVLEFDELSSLSGQYTIRFTHHNQDWSPSNIPDVWFLDGINDLLVQNGDANRLSKPNFYRYKTEFPNQQMKFKTSGNYLLHVYDFSSNTELFSLPFFVTEDVGSITSNSETVYNSGSSYSSINQLFSEYEYPEGITMPQFDLTFSFVQNRFWGSSITPTEKDMSNPGKIRFYTARRNSFSAEFDFIPLDLSELNIDNWRIVDWQPEFTPPRIVLKEDVINFSASSTPTYSSNFGNPSGSNFDRYANVMFSLELGDLQNSNPEIYISGDFNQWRADAQYKLFKNNDSGLWETNVIIKQGKYRYKYFMKNEYSDSDFVPLNDAISNVKQEYFGFVYYRDPEYNYQRLLITTNFDSND